MAFWLGWGVCFLFVVGVVLLVRSSSQGGFCTSGVVLIMLRDIDMKQRKYFVMSGFGDSGSPDSCWDCEVVKVFANEKDAVRFSETHYDFMIDEILKTCNAHWYKSIFVQVVDAVEVSEFVKGVI